MEELKKTVAIPTSKEHKGDEAKLLNRMKKSLKRKQTRIAILSIVLTIIVIIGAYCLAVFPTEVIPYKNSLVSVESVGNILYADFKGDNYNCYYDENIWSKYIDPIIGKQVTDETRHFELNTDGKIDAVYYGYMSPKYTCGPLDKTLSKMTLLWEKK